jgi:hypothetical protein
MAQWSDLTAALVHDTVRFTWLDLAGLVGGLPASAQNYRAWWSGDRPHVRVWREAGYTIADLDPGRSVTFVRHPRSRAPQQRPSADSSIPVLPSGVDIVLVACAKTKLSVPALARDLYTSSSFKKSRRYAEALGLTWFILSAEHALLTPDQIIAPYDRYLPELPPSYRAAWGSWVVERLNLLAGPLDGRSVEVHAGAAYVDALAPHLAAKGVRLVDRLKGLRQGERQAWYDGHTPTEPQLDAVQLADELRTVEAGRSPAQFLATNGTGLKVPGLYSWWVDEPGADDLSCGLHHPLAAGLIYAGLAGATRWPSGSQSTNTLWLRIATMHLGGSHEFSTFRRTVGAILTARDGHDHIDESRLTSWMGEHLKIVVVPYADPDTLGRLEELVLQQIDPPLNLKGMPSTPIRARITQLRRRHSRPGR